MDLRTNPGFIDEREVDREWIAMILDFVAKLCSYDIVPVFILDGNDKGVSKSATRDRRRDVRISSQEKVLELTQELNDLHILERPVAKLELLRKLMGQSLSLPEGSINTMNRILTAFNIPFIYAKGEAEKLCSQLAMDGKVAGVYSRDTDPIVLGCPLLISEFGDQVTENGIRVHTFKCTLFNGILERLGLSYSSFVDYCIMCGCDFNDNIPRVGNVRAYSLIKSHGSIDNLPPQYDKTILNHEDCRRIFSIETIESLVVDPSNIKLDFDRKNGIPFVYDARDLMENYQLTTYLTKMPANFEKVSIPRDGWIVDMNRINVIPETGLIIFVAEEKDPDITTPAITIQEDRSGSTQRLVEMLLQPGKTEEYSIIQ